MPDVTYYCNCKGKKKEKNKIKYNKWEKNTDWDGVKKCGGKRGLWGPVEGWKEEERKGNEGSVRK